MTIRIHLLSPRFLSVLIQWAIFCVLVLQAPIAWSAPSNCYAGGGSVFANSFPVNAGVYAGSNIPVGTVLYRMRQTNDVSNGTYGFICTSGVTPGQTVESFYLSVTNSLYPPISFSGGGISGLVYPTNVPGISVALQYNGQTFSSTPVETTQVTANGAMEFMVPDVNVDIVVIKTGVVAESSTSINFSNLLTVTYSLGSPSIATAGTVSTSGSMQFSAQTCQAADQNVALGTYEKSKYFTGQGSVTPWVDASIVLTNCPTFYGYISTGYIGHNNNDIGTDNQATSTANLLRVTIQPVSDVINSSNGIIAVKADNAGEEATGVGIQIGWGTYSGTPVVFNFDQPYDYTVSLTHRGDVTIPLSARYIQTGSTVTTGQANGVIKYLINYY